MPGTWDEDKGAYAEGAAVPTVTGTADVTYGTNEVTLINDLVSSYNALLVQLREAGILALD